jgi:hypothetical protein
MTARASLLSGLDAEPNSPPRRKAGRFRILWQVLGSNQRRLSRRFYSPSLHTEPNVADQRLRVSGRVGGLLPSAMRPWPPGSWGLEIHGRGTDGGGGSGYADCPARLLACDLPLQAAGSLSASPSSPGSCSASGVLRASVVRWLAALAWPSMQWA